MTKLQWGNRHTDAVKDYEKKKAEGKTQKIDMESFLKKKGAIKHQV